MGIQYVTEVKHIQLGNQTLNTKLLLPSNSQMTLEKLFSLYKLKLYFVGFLCKMEMILLLFPECKISLEMAINQTLQATLHITER